MRLLLSAIVLVAAGGCASKVTEIVTVPPGAEIGVIGYGECLSPCVVEFDEPRTITIAKAGFKPQRLELRPGKKTVTIPLELVAPTTQVDEGGMPELN